MSNNRSNNLTGLQIATLAFIAGTIVMSLLGASTTNFIASASPAWVTNYVAAALGGSTNVGYFTVPQHYYFREFTNDIDLSAGDFWTKNSSADETYTFINSPTSGYATNYAQVVNIRVYNGATNSITPAFTNTTGISVSLVTSNVTTISEGAWGVYTFIIWGDGRMQGVAQRDFIHNGGGI